MKTVRIGSALHAAEQGDAETFGLLTFTPILVALITLITFTALVRSAQLPVFAAARECARVASAFLDSGQAAAAGRSAAAGSLIGNSISAGLASIDVSGHGGPGSDVTCTVIYRVAVSELPLAGWVGARDIDLRATATARVERFKSK
jgi:hypothetical protein